MFKKTEDSEWSRFSKALSNQPKTGSEDALAKEQAPEPAPVAREVAPPTPTPPSAAAPSRPSPVQVYGRSHQSAAQHEIEEMETVIGPNSSFDGTLRCESGLRIKGTAQGEIACAKSLIIEESAKVNAKVTAMNAVVAGKLDGSIICDGRLEILATGQVTGELTAGVLIIQEGAFFEGHLKMKDRKPEPRAADEYASSRRFGSQTSDSVVN